MDRLLGMFGMGDQPEDNQGGSAQAPQQQGGVWEFEMPVGGMPSGGVPPGGMPAEQQAQPVFSIPGGIPKEAIDIQESTIEGYFSTIGWPFEKVDQGLWILKYKGGAKDYDIFVELTPLFLTLVVPVIDRIREGCREKLFYHILRLNYQVTQLRFGINKRNEVLVTIEIPTKTMSYEEFKNGAAQLCSLVDDAYPELLFLSQKLEAVSSFMMEAQAPEKGPEPQS